MRVVAGTARGRRLVTPPGTDVRPTTDRVREAVFNALGSLGAIEGARVLDLFAGSGALGIEALSRGASHATFVERDRRARVTIEANVATTGLADRASISAGDAVQALARTAEQFDLVLLDPPYAFADWAGLFDRLDERTSAGAVIVAESDRAVDAPPWGEFVRAKTYGSTVVTLVRRTPSIPSEPCP